MVQLRWQSNQWTALTSLGGPVSLGKWNRAEPIEHQLIVHRWANCQTKKEVFVSSKRNLRMKNKSVSGSSWAQDFKRLSIKTEEAAAAVSWCLETLADPLCSGLYCRSAIFLPEASIYVENSQRWSQAGSATTHSLSDADRWRGGASRPLGLGRMGKSTSSVSEESEHDTQHSTYLLCDLTMFPQK